MSDNISKKLTMVSQSLYMGNDRSYCNISDIGNYVTFKNQKQLIMIVGSIKENTTLEKEFLTPESAKNIRGLD